jgi:hypothetical protein
MAGTASHSHSCNLVDLLPRHPQFDSTHCAVNRFQSSQVPRCQTQLNATHPKCRAPSDRSISPANCLTSFKPIARSTKSRARSKRNILSSSKLYIACHDSSPACPARTACLQQSGRSNGRVTKSRARSKRKVIPSSKLYIACHDSSPAITPLGYLTFALWHSSNSPVRLGPGSDRLLSQISGAAHRRSSNLPVRLGPICPSGSDPARTFDCELGRSQLECLNVRLEARSIILCCLENWMRIYALQPPLHFATQSEES